MEIAELIENAVFQPVNNYRRRRILKHFKRPVSAVDVCKNPVEAVTQMQLKTLDPRGLRQRLFSKNEPDGVRVGDILLVRFKSGDPFSGVLLAIKRKGIDSSITLRNTLTRVAVEMQCKIYSSSISSIEIVQRREKRARRAKLYYMRDPKHDMGSSQNIVNEYIRRRKLLGSSKSQLQRGKGNQRR